MACYILDSHILKHIPIFLSEDLPNVDTEDVIVTCQCPCCFLEGLKNVHDFMVFVGVVACLGHCIGSYERCYLRVEV